MTSHNGSQIGADIARVLIDEPALARRMVELAGEITARFDGLPLTVVLVANGAVFFAADLLRQLSLPLQLDTVAVASYIGAASSGKVVLRCGLKTDVADRHLLILDDIVDSGRTLNALARELAKGGPASVSSCVLLAKECPQAEQFTPDFIGFRVPDEFVVGYGLDYNEAYRNLPYIGVLKESVYRGALC